MNNNILISDYDYLLTEEKIAKFPLAERDKSKLLLYDYNRNISEDQFYNISNHLPEDSLLIFNNTRVIHARIKFFKTTGATIEIFCLHPLEPSDYVVSFQQTRECTWQCLIGNLKRWKNEILTKEVNTHFGIVILNAERRKTEKGIAEVHFSWNNTSITFNEILSFAGDIPIPPYLNRNAAESDKTNYQTVYAKINGSVAAPTAGLHFTERVLTSLKEKNIKKTEITLHVGAGTFQPVKDAEVDKHNMHTEEFFVEKETVELLIKNVGRNIAVGTTSVRTVESIYWLGVKIMNKCFAEGTKLVVDQWDWKKFGPGINFSQSFQVLLDYMNSEKTNLIEGSTRIMITPGYTFKVINGMITNFHQPKSTLLLLVSAFVGDDWKEIYTYALDNNFRFLSYGDSSLIFPKGH